MKGSSELNKKTQQKGVQENRQSWLTNWWGVRNSMETVKSKRRGLAAEEALVCPQHKGHLKSLGDNCGMLTCSEADSREQRC